MPKDLFLFNHIDPTIDEEKKKELEELYKYYHKLWCCHKIILGVITGNTCRLAIFPERERTFPRRIHQKN